MSAGERNPDLGAVGDQAAPAGGDVASRSRRSTDRLALAIFGLLKDLAVDDRRMVLSELDAVDQPSGSPRARASVLALKRCRSELGVAVPSKARYERWRLGLREPGVPSASFITGSFASWSRALDAAGLEPAADLQALQLRAYARLASDEEILAGLRECARAVGEPLRFADYREWVRQREMTRREGDPVLPLGSRSLTRRFGSFAKALARAGVRSQARGPQASRDEYLELGVAAVREAQAAVAPGPLTMHGYASWRSQEAARRTAAGELALIPAAHTLRRTHGSWPGALVAAGLMTPERAAQAGRGQGSKLTDDVIARSVKLAVEELGPEIRREEYFQWRKQKLLDANAPRLASLNNICRRSGGWERALQNATANQRPAEAKRLGDDHQSAAQEGRP